MREKLKNSALVIGISSLFLIIFNVFSFVLSNNFGKNFWCGYIFITLSWICLLIVEIMATGKRDGGRALFLNAPSLVISVIHLLIQTVLGVVIMVVSSFNIKAAICLELLLFVIYLGFIGAMEIYKNRNQR